MKAEETSYISEPAADNGTLAEIKIRQLLLEGHSPSEAVAHLSDLMLREDLPEVELKALVNFFYNSGHYQAALKGLLNSLRELKIPYWPLLAELVAMAPKRVTKDLIKATLKGAQKQDRSAQLVMSRALDSYEPKLLQLRKEALQERQRRHLDRIQDLKDRLQFFRSQQLMSEERKTLTLLRQIHPADSELQEAESDFEDRWAREVLSRGPFTDPHLTEAESSRLQADVLSEEEEALAKLLAEEVLSLTQNHPEQVYNFALFLWFIRLPKETLSVLDQAQEASASVDWLKLECLLESHRYVDALEWIRQLQVNYAEDPETAFASSYARAKALWGLKQGAQAIEVLESIVRIRPHYRAAHSLLKSWSEEKVV